jgi:hypothetical protein
LTVDGKVIASSAQASNYKDNEHLWNKPMPGRFLIHADWEFENAHPIAMSDLKIWNRAKLPVMEK